MGAMKRRIFKILTGVAVAAGLLLLSGCGNQRNLCPAYDRPYKVEPLPY